MYPIYYIKFNDYIWIKILFLDFKNFNFYKKCIYLKIHYINFFFLINIFVRKFNLFVSLKYFLFLVYIINFITKYDYLIFNQSRVKFTIYIILDFFYFCFIKFT